MKADSCRGCALLQSPGGSEELVSANTASGLDLDLPPVGKGVLVVITGIKICHGHYDISYFAHSSANHFQCSESRLVMYNKSPK